MTRTKRVSAALMLGALLALPVKPMAQAKADVALRAAIETETVKGDLKGAIEQYKKLAQGVDRAIAAKALVRIGECYQKLGDAESRTVYERVVREFADQAESAALARTRLAAMAPGVSATNPTAMAVRQIWAGPDVDIFGMPTPDGRYFTFTDWSTGDIGMRDLGTGEKRRLTNKGSWTASSEFANIRSSPQMVHRSLTCGSAAEAKANSTFASLP